MKLKKICINNYRQFNNIRINLEEDITLLAGANNSGKTSLVELLKIIFGNKNRNLGEEDIPVKVLKEWIEEKYPLIEKIFKTNKDEFKTIDEIMALFLVLKEDEKVESTIDSTLTISVDLETSYQENEKISRFADYIMDLDDNIYSFFFRYEFAPSLDGLKKSIKDKYKILKINFQQLYDLIDDLSKYTKPEEILKIKLNIEKKEISIKNKIISLFLKSFESIYYYSDSRFHIKRKMSNKNFMSLFNFSSISANRRLADELYDKENIITKEMINFISSDEKWIELSKDIPDDIINSIENSKIIPEIKSKSLDGLKNVINEISSTNGGHTGDIILNMELDESVIADLMNKIISANYITEEFQLSEASQGLGYSNLIYIHLQLENYLKNADEEKVNLFIIEEPEAHMHPQMQKVLIEYLYKYYNKKKIQGLITSHSSEIVRYVNLEKLRVIRTLKIFQNHVYDMNDFLNNEGNKYKNFYNTFFNINFSEIIFADKIVVYEGDTEKMFLQGILKLDKFKKLNSQYIAFVQVGGAYAHNYKDIIEKLAIPSLIITDIDYNLECKNRTEVLNSSITNGAIKSFYNDLNDEGIGIKENIKVKDVLTSEINEINSYIRLQFQGKDDFYARTLEEAMLAKKLQLSIFALKPKKYWVDFRNNSNLKFSIPRETKSSIPRNTKSSIRDIVVSTSGNKTDFMYSVIENNFVEEMLPKYIDEGLLWLMK